MEQTYYSFIQQLFKRQARHTPQLVAVKHKNQNLTYEQLDKISDRLCASIISANSPSDIIAISTSRSIATIVGVLAILKAGKAYLPLDPAYPETRLKQIIADAGIDTCVADDEDKDTFEAGGLTVINPANDVAGYQSPEVTPQSLAYVLYTSGSTGTPKGVCMGHKPLVNLLEWQQTESIAGEDSKTLQFAPLSFDVSFQEIFATLTTGGTLILIDDDLRLDPYRLLDHIDEEGINRLFLPFVALQSLASAAESSGKYPDSLREIMTAGEQLKITPQVVSLFKNLNDCVLYNQYGPTECHVVTQLKLTGDPAAWPALPTIGKAISNVEILILDAELNPVQAGEAGELYISGTCLAEGYLNNAALTAEKFIDWKHPLSGIIKIYRSGDMARFLEDGNIELLGRKDEQVKIRGFRVELGDIEIALNHLSGIRQGVVAAKTGKQGAQYLAAYMVPSGEKVNTSVLRQALAARLPDYMIPSFFIWVDELPKTSSGKVDKKALPEPGNSRPDLDVLYKAPLTETERQMASVWSSILQIEQVGTDDNFFELGGSSLSAITVITQLKQHGLNIPITKFYQYPTISRLAAYLNGENEVSPLQSKTNRANAGNDIAVIGMSGRFPGADSVEELWEILKQGRETISRFSDDELDPYLSPQLKNNPDYVKARGIINNAEDFDAAFFNINPKVAELMDPQQRIFLEIAWEVLEKTGYILPGKADNIGVYAGCGNNTYYTHNVLPNDELVENVGSFQVMTANEKDYIASRTAYQLNLKGPAVSVFSGCSTSLLAIAQAVESIRAGHCSMALAGGISITAPIKSGYLYKDGAMLSADGHCRPFDSQAGGTVFSDGAAVVLLKSLDQAKADGDAIYGVIKGIGLNNDGAGKGNFVAPSAEGQAGAIKMALNDGSLSPADISYIEAHGTATPIGDPIEIDGLKMIYGAKADNAFCALGSVKGNLGHLTAAAGAAGLIKAILSLHYRQLPASINFTQPNKYLGLDGSPFYVNSKLTDWDSKNTRRCGVSSFGVGGTNVHVVLEEYVNPLKVPLFKRPRQLITWSAKTEASLDAYGRDLARYFNAHPETTTEDAAYTLQTTRPGFEYRRFTVAKDIDELNSSVSAKNLITKKLKQIPTGIAFLFAGQGSQYVNMCRDLYQGEQVFKHAADECAGILQQYLHENILDIIYPANPNEDAIVRINATQYTQPALFVIEYALAQLWMSWGITPSALVGHSIGEFVAAHLAGVFSLEDALRLVAERGRLMSAQPRGCMAAVRMKAKDVEQLLPAGLSIAGINTPFNTVVSGPADMLAEFERSLANKQITVKRLATSHAFHSEMMEPAVKPYAEFVNTVTLKAPQIPIVSTATGKWLSDEEATDPNYWATQLRKAVRYRDAITTLVADASPVLLEIGPGTSSIQMAMQNIAGKEIAGISSIDQGEDKLPDDEAILTALGKLWLNGINPDWEAFYAGQQRQKVVLPTYAFDRKRCWVNPPFKQQRNNLAVPDVQPAITYTEMSTATNSSAHRDSLFNRVCDILEGASGIDMQYADADASFIELGFDSLLLTQVTLNLKNEFKLPITFRNLNDGLHTLNLLTNHLAANIPGGDTVKPAIHTNNNASVPQAGGDLAAITAQLQTLMQQVASLQQSPTVNNAPGYPTPKPEPAKAEPEVSAEEAAELKKPFGATARIDREARILTDKQKQFLAEFTESYNNKTAKSKTYTHQNRQHMADPRVISGFRPQTKEMVYPIVVDHSLGCKLWDIDGNEYIDALNGFGSNMFGNQHPVIKKAVQEQVEKGYEIGPQHVLAGEVCKLITEFTGFDRAALCNTGSEAVLGAMRIARTVTGRSLIVAFSGSYHGITDEVIVRGTKKLKSFPAAPGIMPESVQNMLILDYGTDEALEIIRQRGHEIAAVLVEPVQSRRPEFQPVEFLKQLRQLTMQTGTVLVFDEVITGFRAHPGGAQAIFGVQADLGTYGKVIGGGMPIGAIAGKAAFMDALDGGFWQYGDDSVPEVGVTYFAGTFVRHPLALAAAKASLQHMKDAGPSLQQGMNDKTAYLANAINNSCKKYNVPLYAAHFGSLWKIKFKEELPYTELLFTLMRYKGIHIWDNFPCFLTEAHTMQEVEAIIKAFDESIAELAEAGFFPSATTVHTTASPSFKINNLPPVPGAKLGKDKDGNPAWFIADPEIAGNYLKLEELK